jgi:hypothetical protein
MLSCGQSETVHRQGVGHGGGLQIDVEAPAEMICGLAVHQPSSGPSVSRFRSIKLDEVRDSIRAERVRHASSSCT